MMWDMLCRGSISYGYSICYVAVNLQQSICTERLIYMVCAINSFDNQPTPLEKTGSI
jgi:hypothetical protein